MVCKKHPDKSAVCTCVNCGSGVCHECCFELEGQFYCKNCLAKFIQNRNGRTAEPFYQEEKEYSARRAMPAKRGYNGLLLFITSFIMPGAGLMYLGLIKRGLFFMTSFFLSIYIISSWGMPMLGLLIPIIYVTSIFDGFHKMRLLMAGEHVDDDVKDVYSFIQQNKNIIVIFAAIFLLNWFVTAGMFAIPFHLPVRNVVPFLLIIAGVILLLKNKRK